MENKPLAYDAYETLAEAYARQIDTKPHNAFYDRPAVTSLWPDLKGRVVLDAGCGPGAYSESLLNQGAVVFACDMSEKMLEFADKRVGGRAQLDQVDLTQPLDAYQPAQFDMVNAALCLDYIPDWNHLFSEFFRIMKTGATLIASFGHPSFDAAYFKTSQYFSVEQVECLWSGFGQEVVMPSYRRSLEEALNPFLHAGFHLDQILEPKPTEAFKVADPMRYMRLMHRPSFLCVRARKPGDLEASELDSIES